MKYILMLVSINLAACATDRGATQHQCMQAGGCYRVTEVEMEALKKALASYSAYIQQQEARIKQLNSMMDKSCG